MVSVERMSGLGFRLSFGLIMGAVFVVIITSSCSCCEE